MRDLRFEAMNHDGTALILIDDQTGESFEVCVDKRLLSSIALARVKVPAPAPTPQASAESNELSPADIQARLRMGQSPDEIVAETGADMARVLRYQDPIINERAWVAERAAAVQLRKGNDQIALAEVVVSRLNTISDQDVAPNWDAWRRDDGLWLVQLNYQTANGERQAHWLFDASISSIAPHDAEAEWLMELDPPEPTKAEPPRRLVSVPLPTSELQASEEDGQGADESDSVSDDVFDSDAHTGPVDNEATGQVDDEASGQVDAEPNEVEERARPTIPSWDEILFGTPTRPRD